MSRAGSYRNYPTFGGPTEHFHRREEWTRVFLELKPTPRKEHSYSLFAESE